MKIRAEALAGIKELVFAAVTRGATRWLKTTINALKEAAPVATGELRSSLRGDLQRSGFRLRLTVIAPTDSATFTDGGTKPHGINPRLKKALRWVTRTGSVMIFKDWRTGRWAGISTSGGRKRKGKGRNVTRWIRPLGRQGVWAVWHPGTKATHWFAKTVKWQSQWLADNINMSIRDAMKGIGRAVGRLPT